MVSALTERQYCVSSSRIKVIDNYKRLGMATS